MVLNEFKKKKKVASEYPPVRFTIISPHFSLLPSRFFT